MSPSNVVPGEYRGVAVAALRFPLDEAALKRHFLGREAYRRTRYVVARNGDQTAIVAVGKQSEEPLFAPITDVEVLVGPGDCAYLHRPDVDTAVPTALARAALRDAPGKRGVVIQGSYGHVSFIIDPAPLRITVRDVVPPHPAKLFDQVRRLLGTGEGLPPIELVPDVVDLHELAAGRPAPSYLLPCRGGDVVVDGATTAYLDERPEHAAWTLIGCERSQQIHEWFYGERAEQVDMCPRNRAAGSGAVLTKCCLIEDHIEIGEAGSVVVPWGATLAQISDALDELVGKWEPTWAPA
jgi:hypothetical protein